MSGIGVWLYLVALLVVVYQREGSAIVLGIVRSVLVVIISEMLGAYRGLGWTIYESTQQTDFLRVWAAVFAASAGSLLLYGVLVAIDRKVVWWR